MASTNSRADAAIDVEPKSTKGDIMAAHTTVTTKATPLPHRGGGSRVMAIFDLVIRICALVTTLAAAAAMGTTNESLPFFTRTIVFQANYYDLPSFTFFLVANAIVSGYLLLSLPFSMAVIVRSHLLGIKLLLLILDTVAVAFTMAAAAAATSIVYLAHNGNESTNWFAICQQYTELCQRMSGAVVASLLAAISLVFLVVFSGVALHRH